MSFEWFLAALIVWTFGHSLVAPRRFMVRFSWLGSPWLLVVLFTVLYSFLAIARHWSLQSHGFDLGIFTQMIFNYANFNGFGNSIRGMNILADHFHPTLILLAPGWWFLPRAEFLLLVQAFIVSLGAVPAYALTYHRFQHRFLAWSLAFVFVLAPGMQQAVGFDFHEITLAATGLMFVAYFGFTRQWAPYWLSFILVLGLKENASLYLLGWCVYFFLRRREWRRALLGGAIALVYFLFVTAMVMPALRGAGNSYEYFDFPQFGRTPVEALARVVTDPFHTWDVFQNPVVKQETRTVLLAGFGWLPLLGPLAWIAAAPMLAEQFLFEVPSHWSLQFHYAAAVTAPLLLATLDGLSLLVFFPRKIFLLSGRRVSHVFGVAAFFLLISVVLLTQERGYFFSQLWRGDLVWQQQQARATRNFLRRIPADASVAASHALVPHLAGRSDIIGWPPNRLEPALHDLHADYAVFHLSGSLWPLPSPADQVVLIEQFVADPDYGMIATSGGAVLLQRGVEDDPLAVDAWRTYVQKNDL